MVGTHQRQHPSNRCIPSVPPKNEVLSAHHRGNLKHSLGGKDFFSYMMGQGQGNRAAPPSSIQLSAVLVTIFKQLKVGAVIQDPIMAALIHTMGALFVDNTDIYTWKQHIMDPGELWGQTQIELEQSSYLLNATGGALKPEK
jgi:hypothetical protein